MWRTGGLRLLSRRSPSRCQWQRAPCHRPAREARTQHVSAMLRLRQCSCNGFLFKCSYTCLCRRGKTGIRTFEGSPVPVILLAESWSNKMAGGWLRAESYFGCLLSCDWACRLAELHPEGLAGLVSTKYSMIPKLGCLHADKPADVLHCLGLRMSLHAGTLRQPQQTRILPRVFGRTPGGRQRQEADIDVVQGNCNTALGNQAAPHGIRHPTNPSAAWKENAIPHFARPAVLDENTFAVWVLWCTRRAPLGNKHAD